MDVEFKELAYFNSEEMLSVIASRPTMRGSMRPSPDYSKWLRDPESYDDKMYVLGAYLEKKLIGFIICKYWVDILPIKSYSRIIFTRPGYAEKYPNGFPKLSTDIMTNQLKAMEAKGYYELYDIAVASWTSYHTNEFCRQNEYTVEYVESIKAGEMSKFTLFKKYLHSRPYDVDLNVRHMILPEAKRANTANT